MSAGSLTMKKAAELADDADKALQDGRVEDLPRIIRELKELVGEVSREAGNLSRTSERETQPGIRRPHAVIDALVDLRKHPDGKRAFIEAINNLIANFEQTRDHHRENGQAGFAGYYDEPIAQLSIIRDFVV